MGVLKVDEEGRGNSGNENEKSLFITQSIP